MFIGLSLGLHARSGASEPFSITLTGLTDGEARIGDHAAIGYTIDPDNGTETVAWGTSADDSTFGTGAAPTDYTAGDEGLLWVSVTDGGETVYRTAPIRYAPGTAPSVADGQTFTVDSAITPIDASASGANLTFTYALSGGPAGLSINTSTGSITGTPGAASSGTATVTATDQYGRVLTDTFTFTASLRTQATAANGLGPFSWAVDNAVNVDATTDFTTNGNTLTYTATGLPAGVTIATNGIISGTPTAESSGTIVITGQDEYGRETTSTTTYSVIADAYAVGGTSPELVLDFAGDYYRVDGSDSTFSSALTYSGDGLRTMVDSDGVLKWAPHNLALHSDDVTNADWNKTRATASLADRFVQAVGSTVTGEIKKNGVTTVTGSDYTIRAKVRTYTGGKSHVILISNNFGSGNKRSWVDIDAATVGATDADHSITAAVQGDGWTLVTCTMAVTSSSWQFGFGLADADGSTTVADDQEGIEIKEIGFYRSDLGGMVNNPDRGDSYVPTTTAAVYMPRRGNHVYNGTSWVNRGLLLESEARTNLLLNSGTLSTQNVTVTAVPHTLHFTGTGTITLSGASTAGPLVGTGTGENNRVSLTFTPSAGTLTCTVTGTVTNAQLEIGSTPSSYIATSGSTVTRAAETATVAGADMPFDASGVTIQMDGLITYADEGAAGQQTFARWYAGAADYITIDLDTDSTATGEVNFNQEDTTGGAGSVASSATALAAGVNAAFNIAGRFTAAEVNGAAGGTVATADTTPTILPDLSSTAFQIGHDFMGNISRVRVWAADLTDANLDEATT